MSVSKIRSVAGFTFGVDTANGYAPVRMPVTRFFGVVGGFERELYPCECGGYRFVDFQAWGDLVTCSGCDYSKFSTIGE